MNWKMAGRTAMALGLAFAFRGLVLGAEAAPAQGPVCSELEFGGRARSVEGSREKFHEYRDVSMFFNELQLGVQPSDSPYFWTSTSATPPGTINPTGSRAAPTGPSGPWRPLTGSRTTSTRAPSS